MHHGNMKALRYWVSLMSWLTLLRWRYSTSTDLFQATHCNDLAPSFNALPHILPGPQLESWIFPFMMGKYQKMYPKMNWHLTLHTLKIGKWFPSLDFLLLLYVFYMFLLLQLSDSWPLRHCMELGQSHILPWNWACLSSTFQGLSSPVYQWIYICLLLFCIRLI